ncbi:unnamed protein product [Spirodela intermedia]|uniref:Uncharacterized protein n=1 Tax=Spirodela intermedia TaxID=51605 RepID=A0A811G6D0_SPIIN|nr:unnamed protein product [Spirodela intermedia]
MDVPPMAQQTTEADRPGAEIYTGDDFFRRKVGPLPIENVEEIGINRQTALCGSTGRRPSSTPTFRKAARLVSCGAEGAGFVEDSRMRRVMG